MTSEHKQALTEALMKKTVGELINIIILQEEQLESAKILRRRMVQIRNIVLDPEERRRPGRPLKNETDNLLFGSDREKIPTVSNK